MAHERGGVVDAEDLCNDVEVIGDRATLAEGDGDPQDVGVIGGPAAATSLYQHGFAKAVVVANVIVVDVVGSARSVTVPDVIIVSMIVWEAHMHITEGHRLE